MSSTDAFAVNGVHSFPPDEKHCGHLDTFSDAYWYCVIEHFAYTIYHPVGTCKMGPKGTKNVSLMISS